MIHKNCEWIENQSFLSGTRLSFQNKMISWTVSFHLNYNTKLLMIETKFVEMSGMKWLICVELNSPKIINDQHVKIPIRNDDCEWITEKTVSIVWWQRSPMIRASLIIQSIAVFIVFWIMKLIQRILFIFIVLISIQLIVGLQHKIRYVNEDEWEEEFKDSFDESSEDVEDIVGKPQPCERIFSEVQCRWTFNCIFRSQNWQNWMVPSKFSWYFVVFFSVSLIGSQKHINNAVRVFNVPWWMSLVLKLVFLTHIIKNPNDKLKLRILDLSFISKQSRLSYQNIKRALNI